MGNVPGSSVRLDCAGRSWISAIYEFSEICGAPWVLRKFLSLTVRPFVCEILWKQYILFVAGRRTPTWLSLPRPAHDKRSKIQFIRHTSQGQGREVHLQIRVVSTTNTQPIEIIRHNKMISQVMLILLHLGLAFADCGGPVNYCSQPGDHRCAVVLGSYAVEYPGGAGASGNYLSVVGGNGNQIGQNCYITPQGTGKGFNFGSDTSYGCGVSGHVAELGLAVSTQPDYFVYCGNPPNNQEHSSCSPNQGLEGVGLVQISFDC